MLHEKSEKKIFQLRVNPTILRRTNLFAINGYEVKVMFNNQRRARLSGEGGFNFEIGTRLTSGRNALELFTVGPRIRQDSSGSSERTVCEHSSRVQFETKARIDREREEERERDRSPRRVIVRHDRCILDSSFHDNYIDGVTEERILHILYDRIDILAHDMLPGTHCGLENARSRWRCASAAAVASLVRRIRRGTRRRSVGSLRRISMLSFARCVALRTYNENESDTRSE